jgi:hypothetical protein
VFAGAAREAVFSREDVIRRAGADFIPVALKAGLVNDPGGDEEGLLYREIGRSKPAPQGICVLNSAGKALDWALSFDDPPAVSAFLDRALERFRKHPGAIDTERFMRYPGHRLDDVQDNGTVLAIPDAHERCPAQTRVRRGTLMARVYGRVLGTLADPTRQENYVEDRFALSVELQELLARELAAAGNERFRLPEPVARVLAGRAYLGPLDVDPLLGPGTKTLELWGRRGAAGVRVEGRSELAGGDSDRDRADGRRWSHEVRLAWEGLIEIRERRVTRLLLLARGSEKLTWGHARAPLAGESDLAHLPAGRPIDFNGEVRYGILGEPAPEAESADVGEALQAKRRALDEGLRAWKEQGRDLAPVGRILEEFGPLAARGKFREAEAVLDRALRLLEPK